MRVRALVLSILVLCVAQSSLAVTRSWTGAVSSSWSEPGNWSPSGTPAPADKLIFPVGAQTVMTNDLPAWTSVGAMDFRTGYTLNGNPLTLTGDLTFDQSVNPHFVCNVDLKLGASLVFGAAITSDFNGAVDISGYTLTIHSYNTAISGAINGTGAIVIYGSGIMANGGGSFSGTIAGTIDVNGSIPDATINGGALSGNGTVGNATLTDVLNLGTQIPGLCCQNAVGTLHTKSISIGSTLYYDLAPGGTSDLLQVTGTVTLGGGQLAIRIPSGAPAGGQTFEIIDNDGGDAVSGTFAGLPEGATISAGGATLSISYHGGDGNDVVLTTASATKSWTGAVSALWSEPGNWSPAAIPTAGEPLIFPAGVARTTMTNDLPAWTSVGAMDFRTGYTLNGNPLTLTGDLAFDQSVNPHFVCNVDLKLGASLVFGAAITSDFNGAIDVNGKTLTIHSYNTAIDGAINGTGAIVIYGSGIMADDNGNFSGTIAGTIDVNGSMPGATITGGALSGNGTVGNATLTDVLQLGMQIPGLCCQNAVGTLHTKSISIGSTLYYDLVPGGTSDLLQVTGTVTLGGGQLAIRIPSGAPAGGQTFEIIENDGGDAVSGTFAGLAEGAQVNVGGAMLTLSYHGGDGNDVVLSTASATKSWTGAVSELWSVPGNWSPAAVPTAGEPLIFPAGDARTTMTNDLPAWMSVGAMDFRTGYTLNGNPLTLTGDLTFDQVVNPHFVCNIDLKLGASLVFGAAITSDYNGTIDISGKTLTIHSYNTAIDGAISGTGAIVINGSGITSTGDGTFSGTIAGTLDVGGLMPDATINGGGLSGDGAVGPVTLTTEPLHLGPTLPGYCCQHGIGTLQTKSISIGGPLYADIDPAAASDRLEVAGTVHLGGSLNVWIVSGSPAAGQQFTLIDNDGTDPVDGTFDDLAEDAIVTAGPWKFRVHYQAGDGNDVVLTAIDDTITESMQNAASSQFGESKTFSAKVTSRSGATPAGTVSFTDNGAIIATSPLTNGVASFAAATLEPGVHTIGAQFEGTPLFAPSASVVSHTVLRGRTSTSLNVPASAIVYGTPLPLTVAVQTIAPATGVATGLVALKNGPSSVLAAPLSNGQATLSAESLNAGSYTLSALYQGDARFDASLSTGSPLTIAKAPTSIETAAAFGAVEVRVSVPNVASKRIVGAVTISENGALVAQQELISGSATIVLPQLATGEHQLTVSYNGTVNLEPSTTQLTHSVALPEISIADATAAEGDVGEKHVTVRVELSWPTGATVVVSYATADRAAKDGEDYRGARGTLTFLPYEMVKTIDLPVYSDTKPEPDERLEITLAAPENATLGRAQATVLISNDDLPYHALFGLPYAGSLTLDLYTPLEGPRPFPLIVWIPGGNAYDANDAFAPALRETARGYAVATVRYRSPAAASRFPAQLSDLESALAWLRGHAAQYELDPERIGIWGASSGAHLAALLGTKRSSDPNEAGLSQAVGTNQSSDPIQAVVVWGGATDLLRLQADGAAAGCSTKFDDRGSAQSTLLGCALQSCAQTATAASPVSLVSADDPPFLIMHGAGDCVVPPLQSTRLYDALRAAGVPATLKTVTGGAPATWTSDAVNAAVDAFLDAELKRIPKRRTVRR